MKWNATNEDWAECGFKKWKKKWITKHMSFLNNESTHSEETKTSIFLRFPKNEQI